MDLRFSVFYCLSNPGNIDKIVNLQYPSSLRFNRKMQHSPIDQIASVAFGSIFDGDIGLSSQNLLTRGRLFSGRSIAGFNGKYDAPYPCMSPEFEDLFRVLWLFLKRPREA